jgi:transglutaminase-like putative cysteine protease/predicted esterase
MTRTPGVSGFAARVLFLLCCFLLCTPAVAQETWEAIVTGAREQFGEPGEQAAKFLAAHRPPRDDAIDPELVLENIGLALQARESFAWARTVSDELFLNDVLPYAVIDESRERWRAPLVELARPIVADATSAADAAQALNRELFKLVNVRYSTSRRAANQAPLETMQRGVASCTGLSILLVDACRSVGIPARAAGIASWTDRNGNHTWVEIHDGTAWRFTGAAEYDANGLDRGWFAGAASAAIPGHELHAIWASSFRKTATHFPLAWDLSDRTVPSVDSSSMYIREQASTGSPMLALRLWASRGGARVAAEVNWSQGLTVHTASTFADPDDLNRVAQIPADSVRPLLCSLTVGDEMRTTVLDASHKPGRVIELYWDELGLSKAAAETHAKTAWDQHAALLRIERRPELDDLAIKADGHELRLLRKDFGEAPASGRSLWISMHGGGGAPKEVNDQQWQNQIRLYEPAEGIYIAPRAPSDTWNLWHRSEIDTLFARLIESATVLWDVDPDRVYLMGYSAGGDGVYQLAPRLADRFAAAAMMAGHPNDASPLGLRNLPFAIFMGGNDAAYNRNAVAQSWVDQLASLQAADPQGYHHFARIYPGLGHWMERKDAEGVPWMAQHTRNPWPTKVVWNQGNTPHTRFYWLSVPKTEAVKGRTISTSVEGQTITLTADAPGQIDLLLHDQLINLDAPITVIANDAIVHEGIVPRTNKAIAFALAQRPDPRMIATARLTIQIKPAAPSDP